MDFASIISEKMKKIPVNFETCLLTWLSKALSPKEKPFSRIVRLISVSG